MFLLIHSTHFWYNQNKKRIYYVWVYEYEHDTISWFYNVYFWAIFFYLLISIDTKEKPSLLDILKKRLAKGEITQEQFESIKATLKLKEVI